MRGREIGVFRAKFKNSDLSLCMSHSAREGYFRQIICKIETKELTPSKNETETVQRHFVRLLVIYSIDDSKNHTENMYWPLLLCKCLEIHTREKKIKNQFLTNDFSSEISSEQIMILGFIQFVPSVKLVLTKKNVFFYILQQQHVYPQHMQCYRQ